MQLQHLHATCAVNVICVANTYCHFELAANTLQTRSVILNVLCHNFYCKHMHSFLLVLQTYAVIVRAAYTITHAVICIQYMLYPRSVIFNILQTRTVILNVMKTHALKS